MLPNFLIIGTQKAATSWLATCLSEHPDIFMVDEKEIHFFNHKFENGTDWYEAHFANWAGEMLVGEATPGYINYPQAPERIQATLGEDVKLIASLRHPVDRAYSAFAQYVRRGAIPAHTDFRHFFQQDEQFGLRSRGYYFANLSRYLEFFPRENMLVLIYEEMKKNNHQTIQACFNFLGVNSQFIPTSLKVKVNQGSHQRLFHSHAIRLRRYVAAKTNLLPANLRESALGFGRRVYQKFILEQLPKQKRYQPLNEQVRQELLQDFMPDINQLEELLDRDLSFWYAPSEVYRQRSSLDVIKRG